MSLTINLPPTMEKELRKSAELEGKTFEQYLLDCFQNMLDEWREGKKGGIA